MAAGLAWVLNLDADLELGASGPYAPTKGVRAAMKTHAARLAAELLEPGDVLVDETSAPGCARGRAGRAFCPTPRAIALLRRAGAEPEAHPEAAVLRRVNGRAFASALGTTLPGAAFVTRMEDARAQLDTTPPEGNGWRIKHAFGMAGRGQRVVSPASRDAQDHAFVAAGLCQGGVQIEPNVVIDAEFAIHGLLAEDGSLVRGALVRQRCDARGAWLATERIADPDRLGELSVTLVAEAARVAVALSAAGYFGPFGVDAYTYRAISQELRLQPRSEINARYSMGFATGFAR